MIWIHIIWCWCIWIHTILWSHIYNDVGVFFHWLESPRQAVSHHFMLSTQNMALLLAHSHGHQRNWLAWIMAYAMMFILWKKMIIAILHMDWPCNATELCMFIGYVNYYRTCCRVAHILLNQIEPRFDNLLHGQTKCRKHLYNAFAYDCKSIACPDHNKWFSIHTNASDFQLGTCIIQEGRPVAYFSCNLTMP
jgi:hypothetical protein